MPTRNAPHPAMADETQRPPDHNHDLSAIRKMTLDRAAEVVDGAPAKGKPEQFATIDDQAPQLDANRRKFALIRLSEIVTKTQDWIIHGFLTFDSLGLFFSDPGGCKTFLAVAATCSVATGQPFYGRQVRQSPVVFIAGEGFNGLKKRFDAWSIRYQVSLDNAPVFVSNAAAALLDPSSVAEVVSAIDEVVAKHGAPGLIVIDTLARNFGPGDENSTSDMGVFIRAADQLRSKYRAAILLIHHSGHGDKNRARGAMALKGALDFEYRLIHGDDSLIRMECHKIKDFEKPTPMAFCIRSVELPMLDDLGLQITSAVLDAVDYEPPLKATTAGRGKNQKMALDVLRDLIKHHQKNLEDGGHDTAGARVAIGEWKQGCTTAGIDKDRFREVRRSFEEQGTVVVENGFVSLIQNASETTET